ncbi:hypothetical protein AGMMS50293_29680 [Spirochaetia bacterium]|nr:hypothetical protein AGMMS50293_29680 [Spirochaetia bacterium]
MRHLYNPLVPVSIFLVLLVSCGEWFLPPLEVVSIAAEQNVQIVFSASPSPESIKKAFTMTEDSQTLSGDFSFNGKKVIFSPVNGIRINREYTITLSTVAEDQKGNSLLKEYIYRFNTKDTTGAPYIVSITPANESNIITQPEKITIVFSKWKMAEPIQLACTGILFMGKAGMILR